MVSKRLGVYCRCVERRLPRLAGTSIKAKATEKIEIYRREFPYPHAPLTAKEVLRRLKKFGLDAHERKLVYYIAVMRKPFRETAKKMGWLSPESASYHYRKALAKLRARKFKLR